jgi:hypothetical protein
VAHQAQTVAQLFDKLLIPIGRGTAPMVMEMGHFDRVV